MDEQLRASDIILVSYAEFQEYQERRRQVAVKPILREGSPAIEPQSPVAPDDTRSRQERIGETSSV